MIPKAGTVFEADNLLRITWTDAKGAKREFFVVHEWGAGNATDAKISLKFNDEPSLRALRELLNFDKLKINALVEHAKVHKVEALRGDVGLGKVADSSISGVGEVGSGQWDGESWEVHLRYQAPPNVPLAPVPASLKALFNKNDVYLTPIRQPSI